MTILEPIHQSHPSPTIQHTNVEDWKGPAGMKWLNQSAHAQSWCGRMYRDLEPKFSPPSILKRQGVVIVVDYEFQSQPWLTI